MLLIIIFPIFETEVLPIYSTELDPDTAGKLTIFFSDVTNYGVGEDVQRIQKQERQINALLVRAEAAIDRERKYITLIWLSIFTSVYITMLVVQGNISSNYALESSVHTTIINQLSGGNGLEYGNALFSDRGSVTSSAQFYDWLSTSVLQRTLTQPICGVRKCSVLLSHPVCCNILAFTGREM